MNPKERYYSGVARETIHRITANRENWTSFLATMARNYDFTYPEQVMIYAQRPNATLCKPYEEWNTDQYRRYVKRGSTGIALFVMNQDKPYLRYVFDVADTGVRRSSPSITPWRVTDENRRFIMDEMERVFQVPSEGILEYQLENIAINLAREYWDDFKKPILDIVADSFLEEYDEYNIEVAFKTAVANSVSYAMYSRITENPDNEDKKGVCFYEVSEICRENGLKAGCVACAVRIRSDLPSGKTCRECFFLCHRSTDLIYSWLLHLLRFSISVVAAWSIGWNWAGGLCGVVPVCPVPRNRRTYQRKPT